MAKRIDVPAVAPVIGTLYPPPFDEPCRSRERKRLGDLAGLTQFGVNLLRLPPDAWSSQRHWHSKEDEFIYVLAGEVVLRTSAGEQVISAGMCVGFPAGVEEGHQLINRSAQPAVYLEISNRDDEDTAYYTDAEVDLMWSPPHARGRMTRKDGTPY